MMKKLYFIALFLVLRLSAMADEGMWIPLLLNSLNESDMQANGLKLSAEDIYSINKSSIKDAIVLFGGGCTSEVISDQGLLLTNHHCGYSRIQSHSSVENDYLKNGFWAKTKQEELTNPGLTATFLIRMENITNQVVEGVGEGANRLEREKRIESNAQEIIRQATKGTHYEGNIKAFDYGNEYYLIITEVFKDVRLVGTPPSSIGKFGGDTDNWMWPRHTGDFSIFRVYANQNNEPAEYADDNVPYQPKHVLPISLKGIEEGDFTMVFGYPAKTEQHLTSFAVDHLINVSNPAKIGMRETSLSIIDAAMKESDALRIQYAAKQSRISNAYKKWIGQNRGLIKTEALDKKRAFEKKFTEKVAQNDVTKKEFGNVLNELDTIYKTYLPYAISKDYFYEFTYYGPDIIRFVNSFRVLEGKMLSSSEIEKMKQRVKSHFNNHDQKTDRLLLEALLERYDQGTPKELLSEDYQELIHKKHKRRYDKITKKIFKKSIFSSEQKMMTFLEQYNNKSALILKNDLAYQLTRRIHKSFGDNVYSPYSRLRTVLQEKMKLYVKGIKLLFPNDAQWPDANITLRLTYGKVEGTKIDGKKHYNYYTTLDETVGKYIPGDSEFDLPQRLLDLHKNKDYGIYAKDSTMMVCFIGSNHTSGGNSGSPAINGKGELIGLNFDRSWESTMSDVMYDGSICRNIMVDIRYVLFIIDKFAEANHLIAEMNIIK